MKYTISMENGSGQKFSTKENFLKEIEMMIDDCIANGGTQFDIEVYADTSCFYQEDKDIESIEKCEHRDITDTHYDDYYEREMCYCKECQCYMAKEECLKDCPIY